MKCLDIDKRRTLAVLLDEMYPRSPIVKPKRNKIPKSVREKLQERLQTVWEEEHAKKWSPKDEAKRLLDCINLNAMDVYQHQEQLVYSERYKKARLSSLYPSVGSLFNHR